MHWVCYLLAGFAGALVGAQLRDGGIELPSIVQVKNGTGKKLCLGGTVGLVAGALAGMYADTSIWNAAIWGFSGIILLERGGIAMVDAIRKKGD